MSRNLDALIAYLAERRSSAFAWGSSDCVRFAFGAVQAQTGRDLAQEIGVKWKDKPSALRELARLGGLEAAIDKVLDRVPLALAHRGDLGLVTSEAGPCLMVVEGPLLIGIDLAGLSRLQRSAMSVAWSIEPKA